MNKFYIYCIHIGNQFEIETNVKCMAKYYFYTSHIHEAAPINYFLLSLILSHI